MVDAILLVVLDNTQKSDALTVAAHHVDTVLQRAHQIDKEIDVEAEAEKAVNTDYGMIETRK